MEVCAYRFRRVGSILHAVSNPHHHHTSPPPDRIPPAVLDALAAVERRKRGGPPLTLEQTMALVELSAWDFNGVEPGHPQYEERLAAWQAEVEARHPRAA